MDLIAPHIFWILIVAGGLTATMLAAAVAPHAASQRFFGVAPQGALGTAVMRNWGLLVGMSGLLLVYAAWDETVRTPIMLFSIAGKVFFAALVFAAGAQLRGARGIAIADLGISALFAAYLLGV